MLLKDRIFEAARGVIDENAADTVEVVVNSGRANVARFAGLAFHQGVTESDCDIYIRVILGKKVGVASTNSLEGKAMKDCLSRAFGIAGHVRDEPFKITLPGPSKYARIDSYSGRTASMTDSEKVSLLLKGFKEAERAGVSQSGAFTTRTGELAVFNTNGIEAYHPYSSAYLSVVSTKDNASGFKSALATDISKIDIPRLMGESVSDCLDALSAHDAAPGSYRALLAPAAVSELIQWLSYIGLGSKNFQEGTSFLSGNIGKSVTGGNVTLYDDGTDLRGMAVPFDMEGAPKKRIDLIDKGIARNVVYDSFTAAISGKKTTGHATFPEDAEGPFPGHIFMEPGKMKFKEMLESLGNGIFVRSFHYVNGMQSPKDTLMTGMTRHGTFLAVGGRIKHPVKSLRFTENIVKAFEKIEGLSEETEVFPNHGFPLSSITVPYILIDGFNFTS